jgi:hypothetical protein
LYSSSLRGLSWSWSHGSWIYNYLCNQCLSPLMLRVCQWLVAGWWFSPVSFTNKTDCHDITEILLKASLSTIKHIFIFLQGNNVLWHFCFANLCSNRWLIKLDNIKYELHNNSLLSQHRSRITSLFVEYYAQLRPSKKGSYQVLFLPNMVFGTSWF